MSTKLLDLRIQYIVSSLLRYKRDAVQVFSSEVFSKWLVAENGHPSDILCQELLDNWGSNVDIFNKDFVIFPLRYMQHISLCVVVRPGAVTVRFY